MIASFKSVQSYNFGPMCVEWRGRVRLIGLKSTLFHISCILDGQMHPTSSNTGLAKRRRISDASLLDCRQ